MFVENMKVLLLIIFVFVVEVRGPPPSGLACDHDQITMTLDKTYVENLVAFDVEGVYLVNPTDPQSNATCEFTDTGTQYRFIFTGQSCFVNTSEVNYVMTERFTAQLFTTPTAGAITTRDLIYCWTFTCNVDLLYNVSSAAITPYSRSFIFEEPGPLNAYTYSFSFFTDDTYTIEYLRTITSYLPTEQAFVRLSVDAPSNIFLKIIDCDTVNLATSDVVEIIRDGCGVGSTSDPDHPAGNEQALDFSFFPQLRTDNDNFTDEFFRLSCSTQLCDILDTSTTCALPTCARRRRRNVALTSVTTTVSTEFAVQFNKCRNLHCDYICIREDDGSERCLCGKGFTLHTDNHTCIKLEEVGALTED